MSKYTKNIKDLISAVKKADENKSGGGSDYKKDFWKPTIEKDQERVEYIIRFLPNPDSVDGTPWVSRPAHMITFASGNYIYEPCPKRSSRGACPICDRVNEMYNSGNPAEEKVASKQCAKKRFFANILVVKDPRDNGANEGKLFVYEYGQKIQDKCKETLLDEDDAINYFDPIDGADLKLVITWEVSGKDRFQNYDKSKFLKVGKVNRGGEELTDAQIDELMDQCHKLNAKLMSEKCFKTADELSTIYKAQGYQKKEKKDEGGERITPAVEKKEPADKVVDEKPTIQLKKEEPKKVTVPADEGDDDEELRKMLED